MWCGRCGWTHIRWTDNIPHLYPEKTYRLDPTTRRALALATSLLTASTLSLGTLSPKKTTSVIMVPPSPQGHDGTTNDLTNSWNQQKGHCHSNCTCCREPYAVAVVVGNSGLAWCEWMHMRKWLHQVVRAKMNNRKYRSWISTSNKNFPIKVVLTKLHDGLSLPVFLQDLTMKADNPGHLSIYDACPTGKTNSIFPQQSNIDKRYVATYILNTELSPCSDSQINADDKE